LLLRDVCQERQRGETHQEPVRRGTCIAAEHCAEGFPLRFGQHVEAIQHRSAELMETAVGHLHLRLDADGCEDVPAGDLLRYITQQRALADARLTPQNDDLTATGERIAEKPVELLALNPTSEEP
jgi:hypothetical protein